MIDMVFKYIYSEIYWNENTNWEGEDASKEHASVFLKCTFCIHVDFYVI